MVTIPYWFIRYGLPAGFLLLATVAILVVRQPLHDGGAAPTAASSHQPSAARAAPRRPQATSRPASGYSVRSGDTFGTIAERFGTTVDRLLALNPAIDPRALRVGQTVRVE